MPETVEPVNAKKRGRPKKTTRWTIYGLFDPRDAEGHEHDPTWPTSAEGLRLCRYVGRTRDPLPARLGAHLREKAATPKRGWFDELAAREGGGEEPVIAPLADLPAESAEEIVGRAERLWIRRASAAGASLLNQYAPSAPKAAKAEDEPLSWEGSEAWRQAAREQERLAVPERMPPPRRRPCAARLDRVTLALAAAAGVAVMLLVVAVAVGW